MYDVTSGRRKPFVVSDEKGVKVVVFVVTAEADADENGEM